MAEELEQAQDQDQEPETPPSDPPARGPDSTRSDQFELGRLTAVLELGQRHLEEAQRALSDRVAALEEAMRQMSEPPPAAAEEEEAEEPEPNAPLPRQPQKSILMRVLTGEW